MAIWAHGNEVLARVDRIPIRHRSYRNEMVNLDEPFGYLSIDVREQNPAAGAPQAMLAQTGG